MDGSRASGLGPVDPAMARLHAETLIKTFTQLFKAPLEEGHLPTSWVTLKVILLHKGGGIHNGDSCIPVSLVSIVH